MGKEIFHKIIPRMKTQKGNEYPDKDKVWKQYGMIKVQDLNIVPGMDVEVEITLREYDKNKVNIEEKEN